MPRRTTPAAIASRTAVTAWRDWGETVEISLWSSGASTSIVCSPDMDTMLGAGPYGRGPRTQLPQPVPYHARMRRSLSRHRVLAVLLGLLLVGAACSSGDEAAKNSSSSSPQSEVDRLLD